MRSEGELPQARVSVIIPTKNRSADLERTIGSLLIQTVKPFELIIVDQSSNPSFRQNIPIPVHYIHDPALSGASVARNVGMDHAQGDVWLFLDDDVLLEPNFIEEILRAYGEDATGVSGIITNYSVPPFRQRIWENIFQIGPFRDERQKIYRHANRYRQSDPIPVRLFGGGLMSFRAAAIRLHRFDPNLTGPSPGEDIDFCMGLPRESILVITPRARLIHNHSAKNRNDAHWLSVHAQVFYYMRERHWRDGVWNNLCFLWLRAGYATLAIYALLAKRSLETWRAWRRGAKVGTDLGRMGTAKH
jgi:GT2 family glycosyltransferase